MRPSGRLNPETVIENRYVVRRLMAEGESAKVYEGHHVGLDLPVVIKQLRGLYPDPQQAAEQVQQYRAEARLLARLRHPNLVIVYDTFLLDGHPILVMEMVRGRNLEEIGTLAPRPLSEKRVLAWAEQLFDTLHFLHTRYPPVIVRGLQPSNIILDQDGRLRLIDFGLAKAMDDKGSGTMNIVKGLGEDGFAPLEQAAYTKTDARSDLYSLGAVLYYLLSKQRPPAASRRAIASADPLTDPREVNPSVSQQTWNALKAMMALRPNERPQTAQEASQLFPASRMPAPRTCVDCLVPLTLKMIDDVEVDLCEGCGGMWLDEGELSQLKARSEQEERRTDELIRTIELSPDHPALQEFNKREQTRRSFWTRLFGG